MESVLENRAREKKPRKGEVYVYIVATELKDPI